MSREHTDEDAAARPARGLGSRLRGLAVLAGLCLKLDDEPELDCEQAERAGNAALAVAVCQEEYRRTASPRTGARLADALRLTDNLDEAARLAGALLATPASADALYVLGKIAVKHDRLDEAERSLRDAAELHREQGRWRELAKDLLASGEIAVLRERYADALIVLDRCISAAGEGRDPSTEGRCRLGAARVLWTIGYWKGAARELERAEAQLTSASGRARLEFEKGNYHQERGDNGQAANRFRAALALAERGATTPLVLSLHLNLAYSLAEIGQLDEAARHLRSAEILDRKDRKLAMRREAGARIAFRRGDRVRAAQLAEEALGGIPEDAHDDRHELETLRAEIALRGGDLAGAEAWARRAVANVERMRAGQGSLQVRSWVMAHRWLPYELLFASLARRGDARGALIAFERWQGRALLDHLAAASGGEMDGGLPDAGHGTDVPPELRELQELERLVSSLRASPLATPAPDEQILEAARGGSLLVLARADGELWRISAAGGELEVASAGPFAQLERRLDRFRTRPGDAALAAELGERLVPPALARPGEQVLRVVLDEREDSVAQLPVAALRIAGRTLVSARPIVHSVRPSDTGCEPPPAEPRRVAVIADAMGNLPGARREAEDIGRRFAAAISIGPAATRSALFGAAASELLHVAVHAKVGELGGVLELSDGVASALEIAGRRRAPARVVLAACASGVAEPATHSMAMGFLAAGARQVIATLRDVDDAAAARLTRELYRSDVTDLARALARLQASADSEEWLKFAVFGRAICSAAP